jgi:hypothetical protein
LLLILASAVIFMAEYKGTHDHVSLPHILDSPSLEGQVPVFISPTNRMAQFYTQPLGSVFVLFYDSQGYGGGIRTCLHMGYLKVQLVPHRKHIKSPLLCPTTG